MPDDDATTAPDPDSSSKPRLTATQISNLYIDLERSAPQWNSDGTTQGLAQRPDRDLHQNKRFAPLRAEPWKLALAELMVWFARSRDLSPDGDWPYDRFLSKLENQGVTLPEGMTIGDAVAAVEVEIARLAPATAKTPSWYEANIAAPMDRRRVTPTLGTISTDDPNNADWLTGSTRDIDIDYTVITLIDIQSAPTLLRAWLADCETALGACTSAADSTNPAAGDKSDRLQQLDWHARGLRTAIRLADDIASEVDDPQTLRDWLHQATEIRQDLQAEVKEWNAATSPLVISAAIAAGQVPETASAFRAHCQSAAREYARSIRQSRSKATKG